MYNQELKEEYISTIFEEDKRKTILSLFNAVEKYEQEWDADICTRSPEELEPVLDKISGTRQRSMATRINLLKRYFEWCLNVKKYEGACDGIFNISTKNFGEDKIRRQMVASPNHLETYLDCLYESPEEETIDCIYRCYFWIAFSGIDEENLTKILCSDVDIDKRVIRLNDREFRIYDEAIEAFEKSKNLSYFIYKHPNYNPVKRLRSDGKELLRGIKVGVSISNMRAESSRRQVNKDRWRGKSKNNPSIKMDLRLGYGRVKLSGQFYRQYEMEMAGGVVDFTQDAIDFMKDYHYKMEKSRNTQAAKRRQVIADYEKDYERWKSAYNLPSFLHRH